MQHNEPIFGKKDIVRLHYLAGESEMLHLDEKVITTIKALDGKLAEIYDVHRMIDEIEKPHLYNIWVTCGVSIWVFEPELELVHRNSNAVGPENKKEAPAARDQLELF